MSDQDHPQQTYTARPAPSDEMAVCALCSNTVPRQSISFVNGRAACSSCVERVRAELAAQAPAASTFVLGAVGGLVGALIGAAVWAGIAVATNYQVGYIAVLVGFLSGMGVKISAGQRRGRALQVLAAVIAVVGLVAAKYMYIAYMVVKRDDSFGYLDGRIISGFFGTFTDNLTVFDALFLLLAIAAAWRVLKPHQVTIVKA